jgi:hypothetical protein
MPGAEPWVRVEHSGGFFKLPLFASIEELLTGVDQGWQDRSRHHLRGEAMVRVPMRQWREMEILLEHLKQPPPHAG